MWIALLYPEGFLSPVILLEMYLMQELRLFVHLCNIISAFFFQFPFAGLSRDLNFQSLKLQFWLRLASFDEPSSYFDLWLRLCDVLSLFCLLTCLLMISFFFKAITTIGNSFFFLGSRLGDSLLVQYSCGVATTMSSGHGKDEVNFRWSCWLTWLRCGCGID